MGCKGCGDNKPKFLLDSDGKPMEISGQSLIASVTAVNKKRNPEFQQSMFVTGKKYDVPLNYDVAIFNASMCTDMLIFPLRYQIKKCDCAKSEQLKNILLRNKDIIEDVLKELG